MSLKRVLGAVLCPCLFLFALWGLPAHGKGNGEDVVDATGWKTAGSVTVSGKSLPDVHYLKKDNHVVFPLLAIAQALGKQGSVDSATRSVLWGGQRFSTPGVLVVDGVAYLSWRELSRVEPNLEYGISGGCAAFILRPVAPKAHGCLVAPGMEKVPFLCVNSQCPGMPVGSLDSYVVKGKYTILFFCCPELNQKDRWDAFFLALVRRRAQTVVRTFDVNRAGRVGPDFESPLCGELEIKRLPYVRIYTPDGRLLSSGSSEPIHTIHEWGARAGMTQAEFGGSRK